MSKSLSKYKEHSKYVKLGAYPCSPIHDEQSKKYYGKNDRTTTNNCNNSNKYKLSELYLITSKKSYIII